ncbi:MAG: tetratricopeptide repeat protein [bacterium]|nr:tetratricopeptide repeat protein [bacterium]
MKRTPHDIHLCFILLIGLLSAPGTVPASPAQDQPVELAFRSQLEAIPSPDLSGLDSTVASQLEQARKDMEAAISEPDATAAQLAAAYGTLGQLYHAYELLPEALTCYRNASALDPGAFTWHHLQGDVLRLSRDLELAAVQFEAAWSLEQRDFAALVALGEVYLDLSRNDEAESAFRSALSLSPGSPAVMAGFGELALRRQDYEDAVAYFKAALASVPEANRLHYSLAMAYRGLGRVDEAREHLEKRGTVGVRAPDPVVDSLQLLTRGERVHLVRGRLAFANARYSEARDEFALAVEADPSSTRALVNLGATYSQLGDVEEALRLFRSVVEIEPKQLTANFNLGSLLAHKGAYDEAIPHLQEVIAQTPYDSEVRLLLAQSLVGAGDDQASLAHFEQAAKLDPASENAVMGGAAALIRLELYHRAYSVLNAGFERIPDSGRIAFALARLLSASPASDIRNGERALELATQVYEAAPSPRHAQVVAQAMAELGRCDEAATWQQKVLDAAVDDKAVEAIPVLQADLDQYLAGPPCKVPVTR